MGWWSLSSPQAMKGSRSVKVIWSLSFVSGQPPLAGVSSFFFRLQGVWKRKGWVEEVVSKIFDVHPENWGRWTHFDSYFSDGLVQPPTRLSWGGIQWIWALVVSRFLWILCIFDTPVNPFFKQNWPLWAVVQKVNKLKPFFQRNKNKFAFKFHSATGYFWMGTQQTCGTATGVFGRFLFPSLTQNSTWQKHSPRWGWRKYFVWKWWS